MKTHPRFATTALAALAAMTLAIAGCDGGSSDADGDAAAEPSSATTQQASAPAKAPEAAAPSEQDAATPLTPGDTPAEQLMAEFVQHMRGAEFDLALILTDPGSEGYSEIETAHNMLAEHADRPDDTGMTLRPMMEAMLTRSWKKVTYEVISVEPDRVRFDLTFPNASPSSVDVAMIDGEWFLVAPKGIVRIADASDKLPERPAGEAAPSPGGG